MMHVNKAIVVGYGSIGQRHTRLLEDLGVSTVVVSRRSISDKKSYLTVEEAITIEKPDYIVVANETYILT